jgi:hypothetical protein
MTICMLLVQRLSPQLGLNEETAKAAKPGKIMAIMEERSGLPPTSERAPLPERQKAMKESLKKATLVVFPVRLAGAADAASAADLVKMINDANVQGVDGQGIPVAQGFPGGSERDEDTVGSGARVPGIREEESRGC